MVILLFFVMGFVAGLIGSWLLDNEKSHQIEALENEIRDFDKNLVSCAQSSEIPEWFQEEATDFEKSRPSMDAWDRQFHRIRLKSTVNGCGICSFCHTFVESDPCSLCSSCQTVAHDVCLSEFGHKCPSLGCKSKNWKEIRGKNVG